jgi:glutamyl-tRNA reductase
LENVYLYDIDDLQQIARGNIAAREREIAACRLLITQHLQRFADWLEKNRPTIEERYRHGAARPALSHPAPNHAS